METNRTVEYVEHVEYVGYAFQSENAGMGWIPWSLNIVELPGKAGRS